MERLRQLIHEIHRRSLWQVLGIYVVASWAVLGGVDTLGGAVGLPGWFLPVALALLVVGLPIVLATAFVQEGMLGRSAGDVEVAGLDAPPSGTSGLFTWRNAFGGGVLAFALLGFVGTGWILFGGGLGSIEPSTSIEQSVAVMPFVNMSGDPDNEYFSDGITEEIRSALAQLPGVRVPGRTSSFAFKGQSITIQQFADTLGVAHVLEGSVRQDGDRVLITATLLDAQTDRQLWSETFNRELTDIFEIQNDIARAITDQLRVTLAGGTETRLVAQGTAVPEAYQAYLRGRYFWNQRTGEGLRTAITEFQQAVDLDSSYAEAYSGLADSYLLVDNYAETTTESQDYRTNLEQGLNAAQRAVSLAPDLGMAHASLGLGLFVTGKWGRAEQELGLAIELSPGYATAHHWYGIFLYGTGKATEGVIHGERALELDPFSPVISRRVSRTLWTVGRTEEAIEQFRETIKLDPTWPPTRFSLSQKLLEIGRYDEGREAWVNAGRLYNVDVDVDVAREAYEAVIRYRGTGDPQVFPDIDVNPTVVHWLYAQTGQSDRAIELFEDLVEPGAYGFLALYHVEYASDLLGGDPRYQALLEEAGITW